MVSKTKKFKRKRTSSVLLLVMLIISIIFTSAFQINAATDVNGVNEEVNDVRNSLVQINMIYKNDRNTIKISSGTCFLINPTTAITCEHVVSLDETVTFEQDDKTVRRSMEDYIKFVVGEAGWSYNKNNIGYEIVVKGDVTVSATVKNSSKEYDFAVISLNEPIGNKKSAILGDSNAVIATQRVYALGFPFTGLEDRNTYDSNDVTITSGEISKITDSDGAKAIIHTADLASGSSGGPLVDVNGNVIGVNRGESTVADGAFAAVKIQEVTDILDALEIEYTSATESADPAAETDAAEETTIASTEESTLPPATDAPSGNDSVKDSEISIMPIIIIAVVVLVIILVVIIILVLVSGKKKKSYISGGQGGTVIPPVPTPGSVPPFNQGNIGAKPPKPPVSGQNSFNGMNNGSFGGSANVPNNDGSGETSVLNDGAGETTVLGNQSSGFSLLRLKTNEIVKINKPEFIIGKERRRVDYCISDNNSISRTHAKIRVRAGRCYISDLGSTNCTFVNGSKLTPNQEVILSKGDKIKLSDEEFEFKG